MKELLPILGRIVWLLLRVVIYALTGHWIGRADENPTPPAMPTAPRARPPTRPHVSAEEASRVAGLLQAVARRADALREQAQCAVGARALVAALDQGVAPDLDRVASLLRTGRVDDALVEVIAALDAALDVIAASIEARRDAAYAHVLADAEAIASALVEPLYTYTRAEGAPMRERACVAAPALDAQRAVLLRAHTSIFPVVVPRERVERPDWLVTLTHSLARSVVDDVPGWVDELRSRHALAPRLFVPPPGAAYDADMVRAALGVWWPELLAEVLATLWLGPAYAAAQARALTRSASPLETRTARLVGRWLAPAPPPFLRVYAMVRTLACLGYARQADSVSARYAGAHPLPDILVLPFADGSSVAISAEFVRAELEELLAFVLEQPQSALVDETLLDIPGFAFLHAEDAQAREAVSALARDEARAFSPRVLAAGALLAGRGRAGRTAMHALRRSVRGAGTLEASDASPDLPPSTPRRSLRARFGDKRALRDAIALGAAFGPSRARRLR